MKTETHRRRLFAGMPFWLQEAYFKSPIVNRILADAAIQGASYTDMLQTICRALYQEANTFREAVFAITKAHPSAALEIPTIFAPHPPAAES